MLGMRADRRTRSRSVLASKLRGMLATKMKIFCSVIFSRTQYTECRADRVISMVCVADHLQVAEHQRSDSFMSKMSNLSFEFRTRLKNEILKISIWFGSEQLTNRESTVLANSMVSDSR